MYFITKKERKKKLSRKSFRFYLFTNDIKFIIELLHTQYTYTCICS